MNVSYVITLNNTFVKLFIRVCKCLFFYVENIQLNFGVKNMSRDSIKNLIAKVLEVSVDIITDDLAVGDIPEWDSLAHMRIIATLEADLGIVLDIEQTLDIEDVEDIIDAVINNG